MVVLLAWLVPLVLAEVASAKLPPFSFEATPASPRVGQPITLTMRCFEDVEHTRPWPACFGHQGTMAWVHPLDDQGALDRRDWIAVEGRATSSGATRGTVVLSEPGPYLIAPLWRSWAGGGHAPGFPDAIRLVVVGDAPPSSTASMLVSTAALTAPALLLGLMLARRRAARRRISGGNGQEPPESAGIRQGNEGP